MSVEQDIMNKIINKVLDRCTASERNKIMDDAFKMVAP